MTIRWTTTARAHIAPHSNEDLKSARRYRHHEWSTIRRSFEWLRNSTSSDDPTLAGVVTKVLSLETTATDMTDDELGVLLVATVVESTAEYFARVFGTERIASMLIAPTVVNESGKISRKRQPPNAAMLRILLVGEDDAAVRAKCRAAAQKVWDEGDAAVHADLAYAFFDDDAWRERACAEIVEQALPFSNAQLTLPRDVDSMRTIVKRCKKTNAIEYPEIVASLGEAALPILFELEPGALGLTRRVSHAVAVTLFATEEAARHLAKRISHNGTRSIISEFFMRHEKLAAAALPAASEGASRNAALAKELLIKACGDRVASVAGAEEVLVALDDPAIPSVLRDAPWRNPPPAMPKLGLDVSTYAARVQIPEPRRAEIAQRLDAQQNGKPAMTEDEAKAFLATLPPGSNVWPSTHLKQALPKETILELFLEGRSGFDANATLATFGERALAGLRRNVMVVDVEVRNAVDDAALAFDFAKPWFERHSADLWSWFEAQPHAAAFGLLAVVHDREKRFIAETALRHLVRAGHRGVILSVTPKAHEAAVREFLDRDPLREVPSGFLAQKRKLQVKRPRLLDGRALGDDALASICEMLSFSPVDEPYAGLEEVRRVCDARSLAEMVWDLATFADGAKKWSRDELEWMRWSIVHFADDAVIRRLTPALKHHTIVSVLEWLAARGVRSAAMELATAHERGDAPQSMANVAGALGTDAHTFAETLLPTTALAEEGTTPLAYGTRTLRVAFDTTLAPLLFLDDKRLAAVPRTKPDDDPIAIRLARETWDELKEDVRTIARLRARSLQHAMRSGRRIPAKHFLSAWSTHALGKHHARAMIWAVERDGALVTFRVAEDSSLADVDDAPLTLGENDFIRVPHYAELDARLLDAWTRTFTDYQLIQPVAQLARTPLSTSDADMSTTSFVRDIAKPYRYTAFDRILEDIGLPRNYAVRRGHHVRFGLKTTWTTGQSMCTAIDLEVRDANNAKVSLSLLDPIDRAEALYVARMLVEGS